ncbi:MAG: radical SAM superfamily protein [uncultured bacterium]|nr:MAG: radical SAM superfamily protein [uncultured bacterium]
MSLNIIQRLRYSPFFTQLVIIRKCNLSCGYCNEYDKTSEPVPLDILKARAKKLKDLGAFSICLTGGEPTMHPDLLELIRYCRYDLKFVKTVMISNGFFLTPELIQKMNVAGLQDMQISIDGVKPNDTTVKVLDSLRRRLEYLKDHAKFNVVVSGVIGSCPPEESYEVIDYAVKMGFRPRVLLVHDHFGQVKLSADELTTFHNIKKNIKRHIWDDLWDYREKIIKEGSAPFKCRAGSRYLYVDENGVVTWCSQTRDLFKKDIMDYTYDDLKEQFYTYKPCQDKCTLGCVRSSSHVDEWRRQLTK